MALRLYNTLTKCKEEFVPLAPRQVTMYTCGPTVYSRPHIGNYSSFLMADLLRRWLEVGHGYTVKHVKNITDVGHLLHDADHGDDKIQKEAEKEKVHPLEIAKRYTEQYLQDEKSLHLREPAHRPRATEYIDKMKEMIGVLLERDFAYATSDGIYFDIMSKDLKTPYGSLSGNTLSAVKAGARVSVKEEKRHPSDFALWKFCVGDNAHHILRWSSPKGPGGETYFEGFPGWHIECSAMSRALLGDQIDIHTGGEDNIFPHHECEIAQSESVTGKKPFVRHWLHKRRIDMGGAKMSKSLGNVLSLYDIQERGFDPMDLRYYLLAVHYRTNLKFSRQGLEDAHVARMRIAEWVENGGLSKFAGRIKSGENIPVMSTKEVKKHRQCFIDAMNEDMNTPAALAAVFVCMNHVNAYWGINTDAAVIVRDFAQMVRRTFGCFDLVEESLSKEIEELRDARAAARAEKDFAEADRLRKQLQEKGYEVRDTAGGQVVRRR